MENSSKNIGHSRNKAVRKKINPKRKKEKENDKLPRSAYTLYVKLYCNKKDTTKSKYSSNLVEATKSWNTLSEYEKQQFYNKYKEYQEKNIQRFIKCIQKAEPFMKEKCPQRPQQDNSNDQNTVQDFNMTNGDNLPQTVKSVQQHDEDEVENKIEWDENIDTERLLTESLEIQNDANDSRDEPTRITYPEPMPPSLKTGKELFEMIKTMDNENDSTWTSLSQKEKNHYNQAVLTLKRDYIQKYRQYLESLTLRELFDYYNKAFIPRH